MITPEQRLARMRASFKKDNGIFAEDYKYFTDQVTPHASIPLNKAARKSAESSGQRSPKRNETQSSDKTDD